MTFAFSPLIGIVVAAILGGAIGIQRQAAAKPAGLRTHLIVATAAAAFTAMGAHLHDTRIPSYIVVGIGFLGGGAIVREGNAARGLTTAASIWAASAVGLLLGYADSFGLYCGVLLTVITLIALSLSDSHILETLRMPRKATVHITCVSPQISVGSIAQALRDAQVKFESTDVLSVQTEGGDEIVELIYLIQLGRGRELSAVVRSIGALAGVRRVEAVQPSFSE